MGVAYWEECLSSAFDEAGAYGLYEQLSEGQRASIAKVIEGAHENYGMAFYSPPPSDRYTQIERDWKAKYDALDAKFDRYREASEQAVARILKRPHGESISIDEHGDVYRHGGRTEQIA